MFCCMQVCCTQVLKSVGNPWLFKSGGGGGGVAVVVAFSLQERIMGEDLMN